MTPLCELAKKHETDKGGWHMRYGGGDSDTCHNYTPVYYALFCMFKDDVRTVLEIGINAGSSLRMWKDFFPKATIYGIDCNPGTLFQEDRIITFCADQNSPPSLRAVMNATAMLYNDETHPGYDLIIDDGSHEYEHQVTSMLALLPYLTERGVYIIEDMTFDCQPEILGKHVPAGFKWVAIPCGRGIGKAHCADSCVKCRGHEGEQLLVITRDG